MSRSSTPGATPSRDLSGRAALPPVGFGLPSQPNPNLFVLEKEQAPGAGRDYQSEMRQLEAQADAFRAEADRMDMSQALRECTGNVARATEAASSCAAANVEKALTKIHEQQERFRTLAVIHGVDLEEEVEVSVRATAGAAPDRYSRSQVSSSGDANSSERMAQLRARATARAQA